MNKSKNIDKALSVSAMISLFLSLITDEYLMFIAFILNLIFNKLIEIKWK